MTKPKKTAVIQIRLTEEDKATIEAIKPDSSTMTHYLTHLAIHQKPPKVLDKAIKFNLSMIGNNINQMTARLHRNQVAHQDLYLMLSLVYQEFLQINYLLENDC